MILHLRTRQDDFIGKKEIDTVKKILNAELDP